MYILYSPPHVVQGITGSDLQCGARALYKSKIFNDRRYRSTFPPLALPDSNITLLYCRSRKEAEEEQKNLMEHTGEVFEIRKCVKGVLVYDEQVQS